eukprot:RCo052148
MEKVSEHPILPKSAQPSECLDSARRSSNDSEDPVPASPVHNGCWADEVDWHEATSGEDLAALPNPSSSTEVCTSSVPPKGKDRPLAVSVPSGIYCSPAVSPGSFFPGTQYQFSPVSGPDGSLSVCSDEAYEPWAATSSAPLSRLSGSSDYSQPLPLDRAASTSTEADTEAEAALVEVVVRVLQDPQVNPHQGSLSLDKLRFFARKAAPEVYEA